jgi:hypothetical protein
MPNRSALGTGSALVPCTGSAVLACLLLLRGGNPSPPQGIPLRLSPGAPAAAAPVVPGRAPFAPPKLVARPPILPHWTADTVLAPRPRHPVAWNLMELVTLTVVLVVGIRVGSARARAGLTRRAFGVRR